MTALTTDGKHTDLIMKRAGAPYYSNLKGGVTACAYMLTSG